MREVDPEVAELLDDLPPTRLPEALAKEGWGRRSMQQAMNTPLSRADIVKPSTTFQPVYDEHCVGCGRPITRRRNQWRDHAGDVECDGALEDTWGYHVSTAELADYRLKAQFRQEMQQELQASLMHIAPPVAGVVPCGAAKMKAVSHTCECNQADSTHFGFHECKECRHLWK